MNLIIKQIPNGRWKENAYIVSDINNNAIILDPGFGEKDIISFIKLNNLNVSAILNTHAHYDHIGSVKNIKDKFTIPFYLHSKDEKLLKSANLYSTLFDGIGSIKIPSVDYYLDQIDREGTTGWSTGNNDKIYHLWFELPIDKDNFLRKIAELKLST